MWMNQQALSNEITVSTKQQGVKHIPQVKSALRATSVYGATTEHDSKSM